MATIGAPFDPAHAVLHFADRISEVDATGAVTLTLGGRDITISREFLEDLAETNPESYLPRLRKPLLILHSPIDQTVGIDNAQNIYRTTRYPKSLVTLNKADHLLTKPGTAAAAARMIATWSQQYLIPDTAPTAADVIPEGVAISRTTKAGRFTDVVRTGTHTLYTDRDKAHGGRNLGVAPTSLILTALAAATSQAIRVAARESHITALDDVSVTVSRIVTESATIHLRREIALIGDQLTDTDRMELLAAANDNEIQAMLAHGIIIEDVQPA